jgi:hypothetical protein
MYGIIRAHTLAQTALLGNYIASDIVLLAELALLGEIYEVADNLFFRRDHPQKSGRANLTLADLSAWYNPQNRGRVVLSQWRWFFECLLSIRRVRMPCYEKMCCYAYMARWFRWRWKEMRSELVVASKMIMGHSAATAKSGRVTKQN